MLAEGPVGLNPISLQFLTYPLELLTNLNKLFISPVDLLLSGQVQSVTESINTVNTVLNPNALDTSFINFLQIEMLGQGLYTYGAV